MRLKKRRVCVCLCVCVCVFVYCMSNVARISLRYFVATLAGLPGGRDTHSSASSHMKASDPLVTASESPRVLIRRRGEARGRGEEGRDGERERGSDRAIVAGILQGLLEHPTLKPCASVIHLRERERERERGLPHRLVGVWQAARVLL